MNYQSWRGVADPRFGYGSMLQGFLSGAGKNVRFDEKASVDVLMGVPFGVKGWYDGQYRVLFSMWETDELPASFFRWLPQYDRVLVPCSHNVELFGRYHNDTVAVPLGVDTKVWSPAADPSGPFTILAGGSLWGRKGLDITIRGFIDAHLPDARLIVKIAPHARDVPALPQHPNITYIRDWMTKDEQVALYRSAHVFVAMSRGEGFGLMPLQAIACGIPTILSDTSGQREFADLATAIVPTRPVKAVNLPGRWDEASSEALVEALRDHHRNWDARRATGLLNAVSVDSRFTWRHAAKALTDAVPVGHKLINPDWAEPEVLTDVILKRNLECDIGKHHYSFKAGTTYQVSENVHQVLYDAGMLVDVR